MLSFCSLFETLPFSVEFVIEEFELVLLKLFSDVEFERLTVEFCAIVVCGIVVC